MDHCLLSPACDTASIKFSFITFGKSFPCEQGPSLSQASSRGLKLLLLALAPQLLPLPLPFAMSLGLCCRAELPTSAWQE